MANRTAGTTSPPPAPSPPTPANLAPPPSAHVVRIPKEQVLRRPPLRNAARYERLNHQKKHRSCCCRCCCCIVCLLLILIVAAAVAAGVMYFVFGFRPPIYTVTNVSVKGLNLTSDAPIATQFNISIRAENPNTMVDIYYLAHSSVSILYDGVSLGDGVLPDLYQPRNNATLMRTTLTGTYVVMDGAVKTALMHDENQGRVPLVVSAQAPIRLKVGSVTTSALAVKVRCDVVLDSLNDKAKIVSTNCGYSVRLS